MDLDENAPTQAPIYTAYLEGSLVLTAEGQWFHEGSPFTNERVIDLFFRSIVWDEAQARYLIRVGDQQQATFRCEDTAYFVIQIHDSPDGPLISLNDGSTEPLRTDTLFLGEVGQIYCTVKGNHRARLSRNVHQELLEHAIDEHTISVCGRTVALHSRPHSTLISTPASAKE